MPLPHKNRLYFLVDSMYRSKYLENGVVKTSNLPVPLERSPRGWKDIQMSFGTNMTYWNLPRTFTAPLFFVDDGAEICRQYMYLNDGYESELYVLILAKKPDSDVYELEYRGRLDFTKAADEPRKGITVPSIEGGILTYLAANDKVNYSVPLDATNLKCKQLFNDGINLFDRYRYSIPEFTSSTNQSHTTVSFALPFPFISNEGDSVGIIQGSEEFEICPTSVTAYVTGSANYFFASINPIQVKVSGTLTFQVSVNAGGITHVTVMLVTSLDNRYYLVGSGAGGQAFLSTQRVSAVVDQTINLAADEKLFVIVVAQHNVAEEVDISWELSDIYFSFNSRNKPTLSYVLQGVDLWDQLVMKMTEGKFHGDSDFLRAHTNLVWTSTNALRQSIDEKGNPVDRVIFYSVADMFNDLDAIYNVGLRIIDNILFVEPKENLYKSDQQIWDIGEITKLKIRIADDLLVNTASFGYKSQDYRQRNGKFEFNTTTKFKLPVNNGNTKKDYTKICKARADCFGIEFIRAMAFDKQTTDTTNDNEPFIINTVLSDVPIQDKYEWIKIEYSNGSAVHYFIDGGALGFFDVIQQPSSPPPFPTDVSSTGNLVFVAAGPANFAQYILTSGLYPNWINGIQHTGSFTTINGNPQAGNLIVLRKNYTTLTGVLDNTVYNIEELTPHRQLLAHGNTLRSLMFQFQQKSIVFTNADKNANLVTTLLSQTIAEKQDEVISGLKDPFFLPFWAEFETVVPIRFNQVLQNLGTGFIKGTFYGQPIYFLPIGKMDAKPAIGAAQGWKLLLSGPLNDLALIEILSSEGIFTSDAMGNSIFTSDLNSLHWNKYNFTLAPKYHHKEIYDDTYENRNEQYISRPEYAQKIQKTDGISIQAITRGLGIVTAIVYDSKGNQYQSYPMDVIADPAVQSPYIRNDLTIDTSAYAEDFYQVVLQAAAVNLRISEWIDLRENHDDTLLFEFWHTATRYSTYFGGVDPYIGYRGSLRVEASLLTWEPDSTFEDYTDEFADFETLDGIAWEKRNLRIRYVPDWVMKKINKILLLNRCFIEGTRYTRNAGSKFTKKEVQGDPRASYIIEIVKGQNRFGLSTDATGVDEDTLIAYTLDAQAFGIDDPNATLNIELPDSP